MKKIVTLSLLMLLCVGIISGCGKADDANSSSDELVKIVDIDITKEEYAFGVDRAQPELLQSLNAFIKEMKENGEFDRICEGYFGEGEKTPVKSAEYDKKKEQIVVATNAAFEPFEYIDGENYYGIDMEIAEAFAKKMGKELVIQNMDFDAVCLAVGQHKCDIAMSGLTIKEERRKYVDFTDSYYNASQKLVLRSDCKEFEQCKDVAAIEAILKTKDEKTKIGVQNGTTGQFYCEGDEEWGFDGFKVTTTGYKNGSLAIQDLVNKNIDYVIIDSAPASCIVQSMNKNARSKWGQFVRVFVEQNGYQKVVEGLKNTLLIAVLGLIIGTVIGILIATARVVPKYNVFPRIMNAICSFYVALFRGTPMVVQLLVCYYVLLPLMGLKLSGVEVSILVFGLNSGAYISEIMRGGIQSVDSGQMEAGRALGLSFATTMRMIVIPQAIKNILPTLGNEFIALIKETSVVSFVGAADLYVAFNYIGSNSYEFMVPYLVMAAIYIVIVLLISLGIKCMERSLGRSDRRN